MCESDWRFFQVIKFVIKMLSMLCSMWGGNREENVAREEKEYVVKIKVCKPL